MLGLIQLIIALPGMIITIIKIIGKIKEFEGKGFWDITRLIGEIIGLIIGLIPTSRSDARMALKELGNALANVNQQNTGSMNDLNILKDRLKKKCQAAGCPPELK